MNTLTNLFQLFLHCQDILQKTICIGLHDRYISNKSDKNIATVANNTNNDFSWRSIQQYVILIPLFYKKKSKIKNYSVFLWNWWLISPTLHSIATQKIDTFFLASLKTWSLTCTYSCFFPLPPSTPFQAPVSVIGPHFSQKLQLKTL